MNPGESLAHFRLLEKIGQGGMGEVWKAEDSRLGVSTRTSCSFATVRATSVSGARRACAKRPGLIN